METRGLSLALVVSDVDDDNDDAEDPKSESEAKGRANAEWTLKRARTKIMCATRA